MIRRIRSTRDVRLAIAGGACVVAGPATAILAAQEWRGNGHNGQFVGIFKCLT
jgi:hypothetical protein